MRRTSVYAFECVCGNHIESAKTVIVCPSCCRLIEVHWGEEGSDGISLETNKVKEAGDSSPACSGFYVALEF